jgi:hypothetical protein
VAAEQPALPVPQQHQQQQHDKNEKKQQQREKVCTYIHAVTYLVCSASLCFLTLALPSLFPHLYCHFASLRIGGARGACEEQSAGGGAGMRCFIRIVVGVVECGRVCIDFYCCCFARHAPNLTLFSPHSSSLQPNCKNKISQTALRHQPLKVGSGDFCDAIRNGAMQREARTQEVVKQQAAVKKEENERAATDAKAAAGQEKTRRAKAAAQAAGKAAAKEAAGSAFTGGSSENASLIGTKGGP